jgi:hypothetical protein
MDPPPGLGLTKSIAAACSLTAPRSCNPTEKTPVKGNNMKTELWQYRFVTLFFSSCCTHYIGIGHLGIKRCKPHGDGELKTLKSGSDSALHMENKAG